MDDQQNHSEGDWIDDDWDDDDFQVIESHTFYITYTPFANGRIHLVPICACGWVATIQTVFMFPDRDNAAALQARVADSQFEFIDHLLDRGIDPSVRGIAWS